MRTRHERPTVRRAPRRRGAAALAALSLAALAPPVLADDAADRDRAHRILANAPEIVVLSVDESAWNDFGYGGELDPSPFANSAAAIEEGDGVYGRVAVTHPSWRATIADAFAAAYAVDGPGAHCYLPHHVLAATFEGDTVHAHLCFLCHYAVLLFPDTARGQYVSFQDDGTLEKALNGPLAGAGIPVNPKVPPTPPALDDGAMAAALSPAAAAVLEAPDAVEVISIDPSALLAAPDGAEEVAARDERAALAARDGFAALMATVGRPDVELGRTTITRPNVRVELGHSARALFREGATMARCFAPRHVLVFTRGEARVALQVCFACSNLHVLMEGEPWGDLVAIEDAPGLRDRLNGILARRGVPVAR